MPNDQMADKAYASCFNTKTEVTWGEGTDEAHLHMVGDLGRIIVTNVLTSSSTAVQA